MFDGRNGNDKDRHDAIALLIYLSAPAGRHATD
jgi:hypothetical protein